MDNKTNHISINSPVGPLLVFEQDGQISRVRWGQSSQGTSRPILDEAKAQLAAYFNGELRQFDLPLIYHCSEYQQQICLAMQEIPYGKTMTYGDLAEKTASSAQAIGNACGGNPFPIVVPCHRVLAADSLGGYSGEGGLETKIQLLKMESDIPWLI